MGTTHHDAVTRARTLGYAVLHDNLTVAAQATGVNRKTVKTWLQHPDNVELVAEARAKKAEAVAAALSEAADLLGTAGQRIREALAVPHQKANDLRANLTSYGIWVDKIDQMSGRESARYSQVQIHHTNATNAAPDISTIIDGLATPVVPPAESTT